MLPMRNPEDWTLIIHQVLADGLSHEIHTAREAHGPDCPAKQNLHGANCEHSSLHMFFPVTSPMVAYMKGSSCLRFCFLSS